VSTALPNPSKCEGLTFPGDPAEGPENTEPLTAAPLSYRISSGAGSAEAIARGRLRPSEWILIAYFGYIAVLAEMRGSTSSPIDPAMLAAMVAAGLLLVGLADRNCASRFWNMVRDWIPAALILVAYWSVDWCGAPGSAPVFDSRLVVWDRVLLQDWRWHDGIERAGAWLPSLLELSYLVLYAVPPLAIALFYIYRERRRVDRFLFPFLLGTLAVYALLPHFPSESPRTAYPEELLPGIDSIFRHFNLWILSRSDIRASVFPSGHVAVGFSAAFAMLLAFPEKKWIGGLLTVLATFVWMNTIYGRYHYAADGLVSLMASIAAASLTPQFYPHAVRVTGRNS
jgi:membrane-associated phospholipid phosphatase